MRGPNKVYILNERRFRIPYKDSTIVSPAPSPSSTALTMAVFVLVNPTQDSPPVTPFIRYPLAFLYTDMEG